MQSNNYIAVIKDVSAERLPPHDRAAEQAVIGAMLRDNQLIGDIVQIIKPDDCYVFANRLILRAVMDLFAQAKPVDPVTLADLLKERREIDEIGGYGYIVELWDGAPSAGNATHYAAIVRNFATHRRMANYGAGVSSEALEAIGPATTLIERAEKDLYAIANHRLDSQTFSIAEVVSTAMERLDARQKKHAGATGIPTGFRDLDKLTAGFQDGELVILGARPSVGKTAFVVNCLRKLVREQIPFLFFSLEQARVEIGERLLCLHARVNSHNTRGGLIGGDDAGKLGQAFDELRASGIGHINDTCGQSMLQIVAEARRCKQRFGIKVVFIDYLQLILPEDRRVNRNEQVGIITSRMKALARELSVPVVCLSQLSRNIEQGGEREPRLSDLRDSGNIEQDADTVIFLHRDPPPTSSKEADEDRRKRESVRTVIVAKQRNGPTGKETLYFNGQFMEFMDAARSETPPDVPASITF